MMHLLMEKKSIMSGVTRAIHKQFVEVCFHKNLFFEKKLFVDSSLQSLTLHIRLENSKNTGCEHFTSNRMKALNHGRASRQSE